MGRTRHRRHHQAVVATHARAWRARTFPEPWPSAQRSGGPTGSSVRPKTATAPSSGACWPRALPGRARRAAGGCTIADAYGACDGVLLPSLWEGFGNPSIQSATHRRPLAIGPYPVAAELAAFGFHWFDARDPKGLAAWLEHPDEQLLTHNHQVAATCFNVADLPDRLARVLDGIPGLATVT